MLTMLVFAAALQTAPTMAEGVTVTPPAPVTPAPRPSPPPRRGPPRIELTASPRMQSARFGGVRVLVRVTIKDADEKYWCPEIVWQWGDSAGDSEEGDCSPFNEATKEEREVWSMQKQSPPLNEGVWDITVTLRKAGKVLDRRTIEVYVN